MFFVWFYAALSVARKSGQGFNARSFADKPCVAHSFGLSLTSRVLPAAIPACVPWRLVLLLLRHVHKVHQVHQVHPAKWFVTQLAPQPCAKVKTLFKETGAVSFIEIRFEILILLLYINF